MIVTTGGQQVIDLVCKTLIDPGDVVVAEGPTYPGAVPTLLAATRPTSCRSRWTTTACAIDVLEETLDRLEREGRRPKFIYTVPTFQNPAGVTHVAGAPPAPGRGRPRARAPRARGQPLRPAALRGRAAADAATQLDGGDFVIYAGHVLEDPLPRACGSAGRSRRRRCWRSSTLGKQAADLCTSTLTQLFVARVLRRPGAGEGYVAEPARPLPRAGATRCSRRSPRTSRRRRRWTRARRAACSSGRRCPTTSTRPTCSPRRCGDNVAFVPGARRVPRRPRRLVDAAELLRRPTEDDIREGVRRIGAIVARAGRAVRDADGRAPRRRPRAEPAAARPSLADVLALPPAARGRRRAGARSR